MATVDQTQQDPAAQGGTYVETPEQKEQWKRLRMLIASESILEDTTFTLQGRIDKVLLAEGNRYFREDRKDAKTGEVKGWFHVKAIASITDPRVIGEGEPLQLAPKKVGASFFNGQNRDGSRSPFRGGMYSLHLATTHTEPSEALMQQKASWDTTDYEDKPVLLEMIYLGRETDEDSRYYGTKANLRVFLQGFLRNPKYAPQRSADDFADLNGNQREPEIGAKAVAAPKKVAEDDSDHF